jgi:photosystem II stability/assembly factor-like uncharacterized protein
MAAFGIVLTCGAVVFATSGSSTSAPVGLAGRDDPKAEHETKQQHLINANLHRDGKGKVRSDLYRKALSRWDALRVDASRPIVQPSPLAPNAPTSGGGVVGVQWTQIGPAPLRIDQEQNYQGSGPDAGQATDIAIDPRNASDQVVYAAFNDGGIWKTADGGANWQPKTDTMQSLSMGAVALDPSNPSIVYAGTGNLFNNGYFKGIGVYRSIDGGDTWSTVAGDTTLNGLGINKMVMPARDTLLVATNGGLFRSTNAGQTFTEVSVGGSTGAYISDLDLDTQDPANTVYAARSGAGIFRSTDAGQTFNNNANLWTGSNGGPTGSYGFVSFAQSTTSSGNVMYADAAGSPFAGMWKSTDGGANWTDISSAANSGGRLNGCQCGYDQTIGVDPVDANSVFIGFQELWHSTDGGSNFSKVSDSKIHWDHHALVFSPVGHRTNGDTTTRVWTGTDGGVAYSDDGGGAWSNVNGAIATNLFRGMDIGRGAANNSFSVGGAQDTGSMRHKASDGGTTWHESVDADGGPTAVDWQNPNNAYGVSNGSYIRTTNGGDSWIRPGESSGLGGCGLSAPTAVDPNNGAHVYVACGTSPQFRRSDDTGVNFGTTATTATGISFIATTPTDSNLVWVGLGDGRLAYSTNALASSPTFTTVNVPGRISGQGVISAAIDPGNTDRVVAVYAGYSNAAPGSLSQHVFLTTDRGSTWSDISGTALDQTQMVPDMPLYSVVIDPQTSPHSIIVSSDLGVLRSLDNGATWQRLGLGLPNVNATSLQIDYTVTPSLLRVGTYGRSAFELTSASGPLLAINGDLGFGSVPVGGKASRVVSLFNVGSADLHVNGFFRSAGSTAFTIASGPPTPVTIPAGSRIDYTVQFAPTSGGDQTATFQVNSDDGIQPVQTIAASGTGGVGKIAVTADLGFGVVPRGQAQSRNVEVQNVGAGPLTLNSVTVLGSSMFSLQSGPTTPVTIAAGSHVDYAVTFAPPAGADGTTQTATVVIDSTDSTNNPVSINASGTPGTPTFGLSPGSLSFGGVAVDNRTVPSSATLSTTVTNRSSCALCDLNVQSLTIGGPNAGDFSLAGVQSTPFTVGAGSGVEIKVQFNPSAGGVRLATLTVTTDDPVTPTRQVALDGSGLLPVITVTPQPVIFGPTVFSPMCGTTCGRTMAATITNTGLAELIIDQINFTSPFSGLVATVPPTRVQPGHKLVEQVTFTPTGGSNLKVPGTMHIEDQLPLDPFNTVFSDVPLCGESVGRGIRVLVVDRNGNPVPNVAALTLTATGVSLPKNVNLKNLPLWTFDPPSVCTRTQFHYQNQNLATTSQTAPRGSYYTLSVTVGHKKATLTFGLAVNEFKQLVVTVG